MKAKINKAARREFSELKKAGVIPVLTKFEDFYKPMKKVGSVQKLEKMTDEEVEAVYTAWPSLDEPYYEGIDYKKTYVGKGDTEEEQVFEITIIGGPSYVVQSSPYTGDVWYRKI